MPFTQEGRLCRLKTPLGGDELVLRSLTGREAISEPFAYQLELLSTDASIDFKKLIGESVTVKLLLADNSARWFDGIVSRFAQHEFSEGLAVYRATLVPWLWLLTRRVNCRIFQEKSVPDILKLVFDELGGYDYELKLGGTYKPWHYCVQYRESDFNFVSRLMEQEGIYYYFLHQDGRHTLVVADDSTLSTACPGQASARLAGKPGGVRAEDEVISWAMEQELHPGKFALGDYNFLDPSYKLVANAASPNHVGHNDRFEVFDYPGAFVNLGAETEGKQSAGDRWVKLRMQEEEAMALQAQGEGTCRAFTPGFAFELCKHERRDYNMSYLITSVDHYLYEGHSLVSGGPGEGAQYRNTFGCIPLKTTFRPARRTPRPSIRGPQTAVVAGPKGEEVSVDKHGRIKVQFHWDRYGKADDQSSCFVRVAQSWAGKSWGALFHPRIGQEVVVEFLEGDPDRPIVTGSVYNGDNAPPYALPGEKTRGGIKSRSTAGGAAANYNEIRLEDKKGAEEILIHAERNLTVETEQHEERSATSRTTAIKGNDQLTVKSNRTIEVSEGDQTTTIKQGKMVTDVSVGESKLHARKIVVEADESITLEVQGNTIKIGPAGISINGQALVEIKGGIIKLN